MKREEEKKLLKKIEDNALVGRGGAAFPVAIKWRAVKDELSRRKKESAFIIANGAEGEPGVRKDGYILEKETNDFVFGLYLATIFLGINRVEKIYIFLASDYFLKTKNNVLKIINSEKKYFEFGKKIEFFLKPKDSGYIAGEETAILNIIEGKKIEPRFKPPFPTVNGLWQKPTLINNIETFLDVALLAKNEYRAERLFTISGAVKRPGIYRLPALTTISDVLKKTLNYPDFEFFVQVGGNVCGEILNSSQLEIPADGAGSIMVYNKKKTEERKLISYWLNFYFNNSCGQCVTCREGIFRLLEIFNNKKEESEDFWRLISALEENTFCALGSSLPVPISSYYRNIKNFK